MEPSPRCYQIIKDFESFMAYPYKCPAGIWTIGWGHTQGVTPDTRPVTRDEAQIYLEADVAEALAIVRRAVTVPLTQGQIDALCSFVFNVGPGRKGGKSGFVTLSNGEPSTLLRKLNAGDYVGASNELMRWTRAGTRVLAGLVKRRIMEKSVFDS